MDYRPSQFAPPLIAANGMARNGQLKQLEFPQAVRATVHVDSRDRNYDTWPTSSEFSVRLPEALNNVVSATLVSAELPLSYYVFSAARGTSSLTVTRDGTTNTVTIPDGNYTTATMATALQTALAAAFNQTFTVTFSPATMKCTIAVSGGVTVAVDATAAPAGKRTDWGMAYYLGFPRGVVTSGTGSVTGTAVANLNPENYVLIDIAELNGLGQSAMYAAGGSGRKTFAKVPLNGDSYQFNFYDKAVTYVEQRPQLTKLDKLRVSVRFHDGTPVDLNGAEWSMSIEFACALTRGL
jgi:hypothetical protein